MRENAKDGRRTTGHSVGDCLFLGGTALIALTVYWRTLAPTLSVEDTGELAAAAYTLGIAHPTGYPLWCILGKLFIVAVPFGDVAWRVNFMSAAFGAGTVLVVGLLTRMVTRSRLAAVVAGLALAFSFEFWEQSVIAEVYVLNAFFIVLCVLILFLWQDTRKPALLYLFALTYGLSLCNHSTVYLLGPVFLAFVVWFDRPTMRSWRRYGLMLVLLAVGFSVHLYLPIRSRANPPMDWGNPETLRGFWDVFTRKQYQFIITGNSRGFGRFLQQFSVFLGVYARQFTPWIGWLALLGLAPLWRRGKARTMLLLGIFAVTVLSAILVPNFSIEKGDIWINTTYWIPAYLVAAVFLGAAVARVRSAHPRIGNAAAVLLALATVLSPLLAHYWRNDKSDYFFARDYGQNILDTLPPNAIYFAEGDHALFPVLYLQIVEGQRPDVFVANRYGYFEPSLYADMPDAVTSQFDQFPPAAQQETIIRWLLDHTNRPVCFKRKPSSRALGDRAVENTGLLFRVVDPGETLPEHDYWKDYSWHTLDPRDARGDWTAELILYDYYFARAYDHLRRDEAVQGLAAIRTAIEVAGEEKEWLNDAGTVCAEFEFYDKALGYYARNVALHPEYVLGRENLGRVCLRLKDYEEALAQFGWVLENDPEARDMHWLIARALAGLDRPREAIAHLQTLADTEPGARVYREMGRLYVEGLGDRPSAARMFEQSLSHDPDQPALVRWLEKERARGL
jgi:Protein O-mannosyl-transferase TMEM260-like/Tetratricopeptide repeat